MKKLKKLLPLFLALGLLVGLGFLFAHWGVADDGAYYGLNRMRNRWFYDLPLGSEEPIFPRSGNLAYDRWVSWEDGDLTVTLGENRSTGCVWTAEIGDERILQSAGEPGFTLVPNREAEAAGHVDFHFRGQKAGTTTVTFTTPCDWLGAEEGYTYTVTVTVAADGTVREAVGE